MKLLYLYLGLFVSLVLMATSCNNNVGYNEVVTDYAVYDYRLPDSLTIYPLNKGGSLHFFTSQHYRPGSAEYAAYATRYGDTKAKQWLFEGQCTFVVGVEQVQMLQRTAMGDTIDVSPYYAVLYRDNQHYVQGRGKYRVEHKPNEREGRVLMSRCKGADTCQWLFSLSYTRFELLDTAMVKPDSSTMLVLTLGDGRKLKAHWLPR